MMMFLLVLITFLFFSYIFYIKYIFVFINESTEIIKTNVLDKKSEIIPVFSHSPDFYPNFFITHKPIYFIKTKNIEQWIEVSINDFLSIQIKDNIDIIKKERYYLERSGFFWKNSNLVTKQDFLILRRNSEQIH